MPPCRKSNSGEAVPLHKSVQPMLPADRRSFLRPPADEAGAKDKHLRRDHAVEGRRLSSPFVVAHQRGADASSMDKWPEWFRPQPAASPSAWGDIQSTGLSARLQHDGLHAITPPDLSRKRTSSTVSCHKKVRPLAVTLDQEFAFRQDRRQRKTFPAGGRPCRSPC